MSLLCLCLKKLFSMNLWYLSKSSPMCSLISTFSGSNTVEVKWERSVMIAAAPHLDKALTLRVLVFPLKMIYEHICQFNRAPLQQWGMFHLISTVEISTVINKRLKGVWLKNAEQRMLHKIKRLMIKWLNFLVMKVLGLMGSWFLVGKEKKKKRHAAIFILCFNYAKGEA